MQSHNPASYKHWVCWKHVERDGRITKPPIQPNGRPASVTNPDTWSTYEEVGQAARQNRWGIGFVLTDNDPFIAIDLDNSHLPENAELHRTILADFSETYIEVSPSGNGYHILCAGKWHTDGNKYGSVEVYQSKRYITIAGGQHNV